MNDEIIKLHKEIEQKLDHLIMQTKGKTLDEDSFATFFGFGRALKLMWEGACVAREGWNGREMYITIQEPDEHSKMQRPYIYMNPVDGQLVPWVASQSDLLSDDWYIVAGSVVEAKV